MKIKSLLIIGLFLYGFISEGLAQNKVGTSAANFLGIAVGPRAQAMGGTGVASYYDVTSLYWNPGSLAKLNRNQFKLSHTEWLLGTSFNWVGASISINDQHALAFSITQLDVGETEITTIEDQDGTGRFWDAQFVSAAVTYSMALTERFSIGSSLKLINEQIWNETATALAVDLGILYFTSLEGLKLGVSISNFGSDQRLDGDDLLRQIDIDPDNTGHNETLVGRLKTEFYELPIFFRIGVAYDLSLDEHSRFTFVSDALHPTDGVELVNLGFEYSFKETIFLRTGYKSLFQEDSEEGLTAGAGINYMLPGFGKVGVDYAWGDFGILGNIQSFAFAFSF